MKAIITLKYYDSNSKYQEKTFVIMDNYGEWLERKLHSLKICGCSLQIVNIETEFTLI